MVTYFKSLNKNPVTCKDVQISGLRLADSPMYQAMRDPNTLNPKPPKRFNAKRT